MNGLWQIPVLQILQILFLLHCGVTGRYAAKLSGLSLPTEEPPNPYLPVFLYCCLGLSINIAALFVLGLLGALSPVAVAATGVAIIALPGASLLRAMAGRKTRVPDLAGRFDLLVLLGLLVFFGLKAVSVPGIWDDTMYHLPIARFYVEHHAIVLDRFTRFPLFPQNMEILFSLGLMLDGVLGAQLMATMPLLLLAIGLIGFSHWLAKSIVPGFVAVVLLMAPHAVRATLGAAYIDNGLALFCFGAAAAAAMALADRRQEARWAAVAGLLAGMALGCKFHGGILAAIIGACLLALRPNLKTICVYAAGAAVFGSWWYIRSAVISGDPFHPAGARWFGYFLWDQSDLALVNADQAGAGLAKIPWNFIPALMRVGLSWWIPALFGFALVPAYRRPLLLLYAVFVAYCLFWFYSAQMDRYTAPIFGVASFLSALVLCRVAAFVLAKARIGAERFHGPVPQAVFALALAPLVVLSAISAKNALSDWKARLQRAPGYALFAQADGQKRGPDDVLVQLGFENATYFFDGTVVGDKVGLGRYWAFVDCPSIAQRLDPLAFARGCAVDKPAKLSAALDAFGSHMLIVNTKLFKLDLPSYLAFFSLEKQTADGVLLRLNPAKAPAGGM